MHTKHIGGVASTVILWLLNLAISKVRMKARNALLVVVAVILPAHEVGRTVHKTAQSYAFLLKRQSVWLNFCKRKLFKANFSGRDKVGNQRSATVPAATEATAEEGKANPLSLERHEERLFLCFPISV